MVLEAQVIRNRIEFRPGQSVSFLAQRSYGWGPAQLI